MNENLKERLKSLYDSAQTILNRPLTEDEKIVIAFSYSIGFQEGQYDMKENKTQEDHYNDTI